MYMCCVTFQCCDEKKDSDVDYVEILLQKYIIKYKLKVRGIL